MKTLFLISLTLCFLGVSAMANAEDDKEAVKKLNGEWSVVSMELGGAKMTPDFNKKIKLVNKDGEYITTVKISETVESKDKGTVTIDPSKSPKTMTIKSVDGPNKGKTFLCIYELNGDELKVCYDLSGSSHPKEFKSEAGNAKSMFAVYKKDK